MTHCTERSVYRGAKGSVSPAVRTNDLALNQANDTLPVHRANEVMGFSAKALKLLIDLVVDEKQGWK